MKLIGFWLLVLLAVLVPATATIASSMICPPAVMAKQSPPRVHAAQGNKATQHAAVKSASHARVAKFGPVGKQVKQVVALDPQADPCCDANPCSHCASCGSCASMAAVAELSSPAQVLALSALPEPGHRRAEFLLSGQERPPRLV